MRRALTIFLAELLRGIILFAYLIDYHHATWPILIVEIEHFLGGICVPIGFRFLHLVVNLTLRLLLGLLRRLLVHFEGRFL